MKRFYCLALALCLFLVSCGTPPDPEPKLPTEEELQAALEELVGDTIPYKYLNVRQESEKDLFDVTAGIWDPNQTVHMADYVEALLAASDAVIESDYRGKVSFEQCHYDGSLMFTFDTISDGFGEFEDHRVGKNAVETLEAIEDLETAILALNPAEVLAPVTLKNGDSANEKPTSGNHTETLGEQNAVLAALGYLRIMSFSYDGLIKQLEHDQYSREEAKYAADNCGADWNAQAVKAAKSYLDIMPFSRGELIDQLEYDGFTHSQAVHGVEENGY